MKIECPLEWTELNSTEQGIGSWKLSINLDPLGVSAIKDLTVCQLDDQILMSKKVRTLFPSKFIIPMY